MLFRCRPNWLSLFTLHTIVSQFYPFLWLQLSSVDQWLSTLYLFPTSFLNFQSFTSSRRFSTSSWIYISLKWNVFKINLMISPQCYCTFSTCKLAVLLVFPFFIGFTNDLRSKTWVILNFLFSLTTYIQVVTKS